MSSIRNLSIWFDYFCTFCFERKRKYFISILNPILILTLFIVAATFPGSCSLSTIRPIHSSARAFKAKVYLLLLVLYCMAHKGLRVCRFSSQTLFSDWTSIHEDFKPHVSNKRSQRLSHETEMQRGSCCCLDPGCLRTITWGLKCLQTLRTQRSLTWRVSSVGDSQSGRVGMDPVSYHAVVDCPAGRDLITGQQAHYTGVPMVELDHKTEKTKSLHWPQH